MKSSKLLLAALLFSGVVAVPMVAKCYRRMDIDISKCPKQAQLALHTYDTTTKQWTLHPGLNCFGGGNGAKTVPGPEPYPNNHTLITLDACQASCTSDASCTGIVTNIYTPGGIPYNPGEQILGPDASQPVGEWLKSMYDWRTFVRDPKWYNGKAYEDPQLKWTRTSYIQPQMHPYDRFFFDPTIGKDGDYTVQKYLDDVSTRYGGIDSLLMWPTYTNIGADDRSQFDLFEAMPGGIKRVRQIVEELHAAGVKVLIPYNPWDEGTLRCRPGGATCGGNANLTAETSKNSSYCDGPATSQHPGFCDARIMDSLIQEMDADGFNGDTMGIVPKEFYSVSVGLNHSVAIEPEGGGNLVVLNEDGEGPGNWDTMGWGYWKYPYVPSVDTWKWFDSRRLTHVCERWAKNHTNALQYALFNGDGFESWENVWGTFNEINKQDGEQIRRVGAMLRFLGGRGYILSQGWIPHVQTTDPTSLFASYWPLEGGDHSIAWTLVNRLSTSHSGPALTNVSGVPAGARYYDIYNGVEVSPDTNGVLPLAVERFGAVIATTKGPDVDPELKAFMAKMAEYAKTPLAHFDPTWHYAHGKRVPIARAESPVSTAGMAKIAGRSVPVQYQGNHDRGGRSAGRPTRRESQSIWRRCAVRVGGSTQSLPHTVDEYTRVLARRDACYPGGIRGVPQEESVSIGR
jgi:hypothetical protein